jgi:hypothetical protein
MNFTPHARNRSLALALLLGGGLPGRAPAQSTPPPPTPQPTPATAAAAAPTAPKSAFELGLNALQLGLFEGGNGRVRAYDTVEGLAGPLRLGWYAMNEGGPGYRYGQNTLGIGLASTPGISVIAAFKHDNGEGHTLALVQSGVGVRVDDRALPAPLPWGLYGNLQLVKNVGAGYTASRDLQGILLLGTSFYGHDATLYVDWKERTDPYFELEIVSPMVFETSYAQARLWIRAEGTDGSDSRFGAGLQIQPR